MHIRRLTRRCGFVYTDQWKSVLGLDYDPLRRFRRRGATDLASAYSVLSAKEKENCVLVCTPLSVHGQDQPLAVVSRVLGRSFLEPLVTPFEVDSSVYASAALFRNRRGSRGICRRQPVS